MNLKTRLQEDMKAAMRAKDQAALSTIRLANAAIKQFEVDERTEADDARVAAILGKMIKQRKDSAKIYADAGRQDLADKENAEIEILHRYLPQMMSAEEIRTAAETVIAMTGASGMADMGKAMGVSEEEIAAEVAAVLSETGASGMADMGKVMGALKSRLAGKADMALVNQAVKAALSR